MTMRRKGSFIAVLLAMMVMLSACGWLDQLWILAKTSRALTTMESVTADITIEAEGKAGNRYLWLPYHVAGQGVLQGRKEEPAVKLDLRWQGGSGVLQIPLHVQAQWRWQEDRWQKYDLNQKQWVDQPGAEPALPDWKAILAVLKAGRWSMQETIGNVRCAEVSLTLDAVSAAALFQRMGSGRSDRRDDRKSKNADCSVCGKGGNRGTRPLNAGQRRNGGAFRRFVDDAGSAAYPG